MLSALVTELCNQFPKLLLFSLLLWWKVKGEKYFAPFIFRCKFTFLIFKRQGAEDSFIHTLLSLYFQHSALFLLYFPFQTPQACDYTALRDITVPTPWITYSLNCQNYIASFHTFISIFKSLTHFQVCISFIKSWFYSV